MSKKTQEQAKVGKIRLTQLGSAIGRHPSQEKTLIGLGLNKRHRTRELEATDSVLGMVEKVKHLLHIERVSE